MDMHLHHLPFAPRALTLLAIAIGIMASQPVPNAIASEAPGRQQNERHWKTPSNGQRVYDPITVQSISAQPISKGKRQARTWKKTTSQRTSAVTQQSKPLKQHLDWQLIQQLSPERQAIEPFYSCGAYIEPPRPGKDYKGDTNKAPIIAESNESSYDNKSVAKFKGDVTVRQGSRHFESDSAFLDKNRNYAQFEGNVRFRENGILLVGDKCDLQLDSGRVTFENTAYVMHEQKARGSASRIVRNEDSTLELKDATYTTCPPGDKGWQLSGQNVTLDINSGLGLAKNAVIRVQGLPILYTPYLSFPIDDHQRKSGFLNPTISHSSDNGLDFSIPYYLNIAPNYDTTLTPRYISKRGGMLENELRYLIGNSYGELGLSGLLNKDVIKKENPYYDEQRWLINYRQKTDLTDNWIAEVDYAKASDKNYLDDFSTSLNLSTNSPLNQRARTRYLGGDTNHSWQLSLDTHQYQNMNQTADDPYNKLPQIKLSGNWLASDSLSLNYVANYTKFTRADNWHYVNETLVNPSNNVYQSNYDSGYGIKRANGERLYLETGASYYFYWSYAFIHPTVKVQHVEYRLTGLSASEVETDLKAAYSSFTAANYTESPKTTVPTFSIDSGLYFDRFTNIGGTEFTHTLEPEIKYLYSPYKEGQEMNPVFDTALMNFNYSSLWRDTRFSGHDRLGDANQLSFGLTTRLIEDDGFERVRFGLVQIIYFEDRQLWISPKAGIDPSIAGQNAAPNDNTERLREDMKNSVSPLASELVYNISHNMNVRQELMWDTTNNKLYNHSFYYQYRPNDRQVLNAGYRYLHHQAYLSTAWPVSNNWSALGRWQYDLANKRNLEILSGVEYNSCCYQIRVLWRKWVDDDDNIDYTNSKSGIFLQLVLRGLGDLTSGSTKKYLKGIEGYAGDEK